jgi:hypothetical protein
MSVFDDLRALLRLRAVQMAGLAGYLAFIGGFSFYTKLSVIDNDIWWHLKVGDWIVEHLAVPHTGILSRTAAGRPWVAYSWGYEVLMSFAYRWFGIMGIGLYGTLLTIAVAYAVFWMLLRLSGRFWWALVLAAMVCWSFLFNGMPRPVFFSMVLFCITLVLLLEASRSGRVEVLYWLPLIFLVWTNLHIQFIYGLFLVGLLMATTVVQRVGSAWGFAPSFLQPATLPAMPQIAVFAACVLATMMGPNFYHPYVAVYEYSKAKFAYKVIIELQPLSFRGSSHFVQLALTVSAFTPWAGEKSSTYSSWRCSPSAAWWHIALCAMPGSSQFRRRHALPTSLVLRPSATARKTGWSDWALRRLWRCCWSWFRGARISPSADSTWPSAPSTR